MNTNKNVADLINAADSADQALAGAIEAAGAALTLAAEATYVAISEGAKAKDIAELTPFSNKDTVARLAVVGQFLTLEGEYTPEGVSVAHVVRVLVNKCVQTKGVGLPGARKAISEASDRASAAKNLVNACKVNTPVDETPADEQDETVVPSEVVGFDPIAALSGAAKIVGDVLAALVDVDEDERADVLAAAIALGDMVACLVTSVSPATVAV